MAEAPARQDPVQAEAAAPEKTQEPAQPAPAPAQGAPPTQQQDGLINHDDMHAWTTRFNDAIARPSEHINSRSPEGASSWFAGFFDCFDPIDLGAITCCLPCLTFGKTHHRLNKGGDLAGYKPVNTSCMMLCALNCCGCGFLPQALQRQQIREKYNLEGSCISDLIFTLWCGCCSLVQQDKEVEYREKLLKENPQQYQPNAGMTYAPAS